MRELTEIEKYARIVDMPRPKKPSVRVGPAKYGQGVYALKKFRTGQHVGTVTGEVIRDKDYGSEYCIDLGRGRSLEPATPFRFLNHSCDPNCELFVREYHPKTEERLSPPEVFVETKRPVEIEQELTIDYGWSADAAIRCGCGSPNCRGWIVSADELPLVNQPKKKSSKKKPAKKSKKNSKKKSPAARKKKPTDG